MFNIFIVLSKGAAQSTLEAKKKRVFSDRNDVRVGTFCQITLSKSQKLQKTVCCLFRLTRSPPSLSIFEYTQFRKAEDNSQPHSDLNYLLFFKGAITDLFRIFVCVVNHDTVYESIIDLRLSQATGLCLLGFGCPDRATVTTSPTAPAIARETEGQEASQHNRARRLGRPPPVMVTHKYTGS